MNEIKYVVLSPNGDRLHEETHFNMGFAEKNQRAINIAHEFITLDNNDVKVVVQETLEGDSSFCSVYSLGQDGYLHHRTYANYPF